MHAAKITVCIPTFNRLELLKRSIASVTDQAMACVRIHVFDNASTDGTEAWMRALVRQNPDIAYFRNPENCGALENIRKVIASADTPFFVPLADDDWLLPDSLHALLDALEADSSLGAVVAQTTRINSVNGERWTNPNRESWEFRYFAPREIIPALINKGHFEWSSILFSAAAYHKVGGYRSEVGLPADVDLQIRLFWRYPVKLIEQVCAVWYLHPSQTTSSIQTADAACGMLKIAYGMISEEELESSGSEVKQAVDHLRKSTLKQVGKSVGRTLQPRSFWILQRALAKARVSPAMQMRAYGAIIKGVAAGVRDQLSKSK